MGRTIFRGLWPLLCGFATIFVLVAPAEAGKAAEVYVQKIADQAIAVINNAVLSPAERETQLSALLDANIDMKTIGLFTLGQYRRDASEADIAAFLPVFRDYLIAFYLRNLSNLARTTFKVTHSTDLDGKKGVIVYSTAATQGGDPAQINWRVIADNSIQDVQVGGVWMALALREQLVSVIENNQGRVSAATERLKEIVAGL